MALTTEEKAQKAFKQEETRREGAKNLAEYRQAQIKEMKKTERLRAMRLAQEAELAATERASAALDAPPKAAPKKKAAKPATRKAARKPARPTH